MKSEGNGGDYVALRINKENNMECLGDSPNCFWCKDKPCCLSHVLNRNGVGVVCTSQYASGHWCNLKINCESYESIIVWYYYIVFCTHYCKQIFCSLILK